MNAIIHERGNGFPDAGDYVPGVDGDLYRVVSVGTGHIHTGQPGQANYIYATVETVDWDDCEEDDLFPAIVELDETAYGVTFAEWLEAAGHSDDPTSDYDLRAAWRAGEDPAEYASA